MLPVLVPVPGAFHLAMGPDDDGDRQSWTKLDCGLGLDRSSRRWLSRGVVTWVLQR